MKTGNLDAFFKEKCLTKNTADSIAYWLGKDPSFVHTIEELHSSHPEASSEQIMDYYTQALS